MYNFAKVANESSIGSNPISSAKLHCLLIGRKIDSESINLGSTPSDVTKSWRLKGVSPDWKCVREVYGSALEMRLVLKPREFESLRFRMAYKNREDQLSCQRRHYKRNKDARIQLNIIRRLEIRSMLNKIKSSSGCLLCKENTPICLDFHHLDRKTKDIELSKARSNGWSDNRLLNEISKCVVLCSNCHRKVEVGLIKIP